MIGLEDNNYDYRSIYKSNCENVVGSLRIPVGMCGPLIVNGIKRFIPIVMTEGALVSSINRGCKGLTESGGVNTIITKSGMTRAPLLRVQGVRDIPRVVEWLKSNYGLLKQEFEKTTSVGTLESIDPYFVGPEIHLRVRAFSGDAMGMNMVTKGTEAIVNKICSELEGVKCLTLSGNMCTDKKIGTMNWIEGRGTSGIGEAVIPGRVLDSVFGVTSKELVSLNRSKNLLGSIRAGLIGGSNCHAANVVVGIFCATGQDLGQIGTSSQSIIDITEDEDTDGIVITNTMPCIEVGVIGGGIGLKDQTECLKIIGEDLLPSKSKENVGDSVKRLAGTIIGTVMAGEISLLSAMVKSDLVKSHMNFGRK